MGRYYKDYSDFISEHFEGRMQKLAINAGLICPNRDGSIGHGGCSYCVNSSFNPSYCDPLDSVRAQIEKGKEFFRRKYPNMRFLAYFQAYTNTNASIDHLMGLYREALEVDGVDGLIIGTRPDCMPQQLLGRLAALGRWVMIEYGAESANDSTLARVNRCHRWADTVDAVNRTASAGIPCGLHLIAGLPGERLDDTLATVDKAIELPIATLKIHQLQILRGSRLAADIAAGRECVMGFTLEEYLNLCVEIVRRVPRHIALERFLSSSPPDMLISPRWGLKNYQFTHLLHNRLASEARSLG